jgi:hypothetical protein
MNRNEVSPEQFDELVAQAKVLAEDVNDLMNALRLVASLDTPLDKVRDIAHRALNVLAARGVGDVILQASIKENACRYCGEAGSTPEHENVCPSAPTSVQARKSG